MLKKPQAKILQEWSATIEEALLRNGLSRRIEGLTETLFEEDISNYSDQKVTVCREFSYQGRVLARLSRAGCIYHSEAFFPELETIEEVVLA